MTSPLTTTRLRKAATDNGFDLEQVPAGQWLSFISTKAPLKIWLTGDDERSLNVALSHANVVRELTDYGAPCTVASPSGAVGAINVGTFEALYHLLRRAFQLSRALPYELLNEFEERTAALLRSTEIERLVVQRVGQDVFRRGLIDYWEGRCAITELDVVDILRASHTKPWAACDDDAERLDVFNGFLLAPSLDAVFDRGYMTIANDGALIYSPQLSESARRQLCLADTLRALRLREAHMRYLLWHREHVFIRG